MFTVLRTHGLPLMMATLILSNPVLGTSIPLLSLHFQNGFAQQKEESKYILGVHPSVGNQNKSRSIMAKVFSGRKRSWNNGVPVQLILFPEESPEMKWLCKEILHVPEHLLRRFIHQKVYRGTMREPIYVRTQEEALFYLLKTRGAVAPLLKQESATALQNSTIIQLTVK